MKEGKTQTLLLVAGETQGTEEGKKGTALVERRLGNGTQGGNGRGKTGQAGVETGKKGGVQRISSIGVWLRVGVLERSGGVVLSAEKNSLGGGAGDEGVMQSRTVSVPGGY